LGISLFERQSGRAARAKKILETGMFDLCPVSDLAYHLLVQLKMKNLNNLRRKQ